MYPVWKSSIHSYQGAGKRNIFQDAPILGIVMTQDAFSKTRYPFIASFFDHSEAFLTKTHRKQALGFTLSLLKRIYIYNFTLFLGVNTTAQNIFVNTGR